MRFASYFKVTFERYYTFERYPEFIESAVLKRPNVKKKKMKRVKCWTRRESSVDAVDPVYSAASIHVTRENKYCCAADRAFFFLGLAV